MYELVPALAGLTLAVATGAAATALAMRWRSRGMAVLGVLGGLAAPLLVGAPSGGATAAILFAAALAAAAICVREGWDWLGLAAFVVVTPQWLAGLADNPPSDAGIFLTLAAFGALFAAAAVGHDLAAGARGRARRTTPAAARGIAAPARPQRLRRPGRPGGSASRSTSGRTPRISGSRASPPRTSRARGSSSRAPGASRALAVAMLALGDDRRRRRDRGRR